MGLFGDSEEKTNQVESSGVVNNNLILNNELKVTDNETEFYMKLLVLIQAPHTHNFKIYCEKSQKKLNSIFCLFSTVSTGFN